MQHITPEETLAALEAIRDKLLPEIRPTDSSVDWGKDNWRLEKVQGLILDAIDTLMISDRAGIIRSGE